MEEKFNHHSSNNIIEEIYHERYRFIFKYAYGFLSSQEDIQDLINSLVKKASQRIKVKDPQNGTILTTSAQVEQTMKRLWDLYKTFCDRLQSLEPDF